MQQGAGCAMRGPSFFTGDFGGKEATEANSLLHQKIHSAHTTHPLLKSLYLSFLLEVRD